MFRRTYVIMRVGSNELTVLIDNIEAMQLAYSRALKNANTAYQDYKKHTAALHVSMLALVNMRLQGESMVRRVNDSMEDIIRRVDDAA